MDGAGADPKTDARTLFVRNVAYDVDAAQLEEVFTDIGPVRQCFLVTDKQQQAAAAAGPLGAKRHKGIAFVQFAIPEDAERALEELNGKEVAGRRLKVRVGFQCVCALGCEREWAARQRACDSVQTCMCDHQLCVC
jgi:nucleolar protein 4